LSCCSIKAAYSTS